MKKNVLIGTGKLDFVAVSTYLSRLLASEIQGSYH